MTNFKKLTLRHIVTAPELPLLSTEKVARWQVCFVDRTSYELALRAPFPH